jgi:hypothetical protein
MKEKLGQEPAYPSKRYDINGSMDKQYKGISKRLYTAIQIAQALSTRFDTITQMDRKRIAKDAFEITDELLKQENK